MSLGIYLYFWTCEGKIIDNEMLMNLQGNGGQVAVFEEFDNSTFFESKDTAGETILYPNPARDVVFVELNDSSTRSASVSLFSMNGKKIFSKELVVNHNRIRVPISSIPPGIYLITLLASDQEFSQVIYIK